MAVETVTVRMSRSDGSTPWGFRLQGGQEYGNILTIGPVAAGSLADRAGLHNGDAVTQLCGRDAQRMPHQDAQNIIVSSGNTLDLIVQRAGGAHIWKPSITQLGQDTTVSKFQHTVHSTGSSSHAPPPGPPPPPPMSAPPPQPAKSVKVSLEHQPQTGGNIPGYNSAARPFNTSSRSTASSTTTGGPEVKHLQYNSPLNLYSQNNAAEQYLQQTGGLFGTDPNLNKAKEEPAYLKSATLRLIQESEQDVRSGRASPRQPNEWAEGRSETLHHTDAHQQSDSFKRLSSALGTPAAPREASPGRAPSPRFDGGVPVCYCCGRSIIGVFCKASGKSLHPECFNCSTCGMSLKNIGHVLHNNKIYCETHGNQNKHLHFGAAPPVAPNAFL
uniref:PDZ and LIM domain protein Zasp n=1 Tax=Plectus sambesii TaxID=2011161 RepID=A0A914WBM4_9BILA